MKMAPHLIHPLRFVLPHVPSSRPKWLLRAGSYFYMIFWGKRKILPASSSVNFKTDISGALLKCIISQALNILIVWWMIID